MRIHSRQHIMMAGRLRAAAEILESMGEASPECLDACYPVVAKVLELVNYKIYSVTGLPRKFDAIPGKRENGAARIPPMAAKD